MKSVTEGLAHTLRERVGDRITAHLLIPGFTYTGMTTRHFKEKPPAAWTPDQVAQTMLDGIARRDFYLWCLDNETSWEVDRRRVLWTARTSPKAARRCRAGIPTGRTCSPTSPAGSEP